MLRASDPAALAVTLAAVAIATAVDVRSRRIPNVVTLPAAAAGFGLAAAGWSQVSLSAALLGMFLGLVLMLPGHLLGRTGGGDVKLMAALGATLGPGGIVAAFVYAAVAGGLLAIAVALARRRLRNTLRRAGRLIVAPSDGRSAVDSVGDGNEFPYAPAIAAGAIAAALGL